MEDRKRLIALIAIMVGVAATVGASATYLIYQGGIERQRLRLQDIVKNQARHTEVLAAFNKAYSTYPAGPEAGTIAQLVEGYLQFQHQGLGETGEITLARRDGDKIVFLLRHRAELEHPATVAMNAGLAEPMRAALSGQSGTMIGNDYAGNMVLAAYEPISGLNLGLVAKIDLAEVRERFTQISARLALISLLTVAVASALFYVISEPMIRRLRQNEVRFRELFESMSGGAAVYETVGAGEDFVFTDLNRKGEQIERVDRAQVIGRRLTEVLPGLRGSALLEGLKQVWQSGKSKSFPPYYYRDERIEGWRESYAYKLPSGEIVSLFDDVSERQHAEEALRESATRFRGTFENAAVGIAHVGMDGSWLRVNQRLCDIVGYSRDELLTRTFQDITHADDLETDRDQLARLTLGEISSYDMEKRCIRKQGDVVWIRLTVALQRDDTGKPLYRICIVENIGARKRTEQSLHESESRMRALLDASQDEILLLSTEGLVLAINEAAERRLAHRIAGSESAGVHLRQLLPHDLAEARMATVRDVAKSRQLAHLDVPIRARWFEFWFYPVLRSNEPVSEVAVYAREITQRKRAEHELRRLYQAIQQSPASVVITDPKGDIVYVNPKFSEVTGYSDDEVIGKNPRILKSGDATSQDYQKLWTTILSGQVWKGEFHNRKKNGELFWELASIAPVKDNLGKIINFVAVKEDITERRAIEEQLRQSQKMQAVGQLTGGIAHDFNNLLTIIVGNLELLEESLGNNPKQQRFVADAVWAVRRGGELTHRLLAFARLQPLRPTVANLTDVVRGLTELLRRTLGATIQVEEDLAPDLENVEVDVGELERALVNLAINARDAMPNGGTLALETRNAIVDDDYAQRHPDVTSGKYVVLAVSDTGTGMPPEVLRRVFEPFFTTKKVGQGSGLGLSMVYGFTKQSGGHIAVYSEAGHGTTFKLFFPQASPSGAIIPAPSADEAGFSAQGKVALIVEDEERLRKVAATILQNAGFSVLEAENGSDAICQAETAAVDLLFTDIELPGGMNGFEVAQRVKQQHARLRVLYTTGYSVGLRTGSGPLPQGDALLAKPYARQELMRQLRALFPECAS